MNTRVFALVLLLIIGFSMIEVGHSSTIITVGVDPAQVPGRVGKNIQFNIYVSGIDASVQDLFAWQLKLSWTDIYFNLISVEEGPFLEQNGITSGLMISRVVSGGKEIMTLACTLLGSVSGVRGEGVLATVTLYVIAGITGERFELSEIKLRNSSLNPIEPPTYDVVVLDEAGEFIVVPRPWDLEPLYGEIDLYDLGIVAANFGRNVTRVRKISTGWAALVGGGWTDPQNVGSSDNIKSFTKDNGDATVWKDFRFNTTGWSPSVTGVTVEVGLERSIETGRDIVNIAISNNNGSSWSATTFNHVVGDAPDVAYVDRFVWVDVTSAYTWTVGMVGSIAVKLTYVQDGVSPTTIAIDYLLVRVTPLPLKGPPEAFDPDADLNNDRRIDIDDLVLVAVNYGTYALVEEE